MHTLDKKEGKIKVSRKIRLWPPRAEAERYEAHVVRGCLCMSQDYNRCTNCTPLLCCVASKPSTALLEIARKGRATGAASSLYRGSEEMGTCVVAANICC